MVRTYRPRRGLNGSATEDWIAAALEAQQQPHAFEPGRHENCGRCALPSSAEVHTETAR
jgi:hypothetical protein